MTCSEVITCVLLYRERVLFGQSTGPSPLNHRDDFSVPSSLAPWELESLLLGCRVSIVLSLCDITGPIETLRLPDLSEELHENPDRRAARGPSSHNLF